MRQNLSTNCVRKSSLRLPYTQPTKTQKNVKNLILFANKFGKCPQKALKYERKTMAKKQNFNPLSMKSEKS